MGAESEILGLGFRTWLMMGGILFYPSSPHYLLWFESERAKLFFLVCFSFVETEIFFFVTGLRLRGL